MIILTASLWFVWMTDATTGRPILAFEDTAFTTRAACQPHLPPPHTGYAGDHWIKVAFACRRGLNPYAPEAQL